MRHSASHIVTKLSGEVCRILALDDSKSRLRAFGAEVTTTIPKHFVELIRAEIAEWKKVVKVAGARVD